MSHALQKGGTLDGSACRLPLCCGCTLLYLTCGCRFMPPREGNTGWCCLQAHRVLWLYIAVFDLAGLAGEAAPASRRRQEAVRAAIGRLAASAPICLLVGLQASSERLEAELWERLQFLGRCASLTRSLIGVTAAHQWLAHVVARSVSLSCPQALLHSPVPPFKAEEGNKAGAREQSLDTLVGSLLCSCAFFVALAVMCSAPGCGLGAPPSVSCLENRAAPVARAMNGSLWADQLRNSQPHCRQIAPCVVQLPIAFCRWDSAQILEGNTEGAGWKGACRCPPGHS